MTYRECLQFLFSQLPMYQRIGQAAYKADLKSTINLCNLIGNPQEKFKSVHIAGTNGKGSVSHMLAAIFQESGYTTGLYTSPHLKDFRERVKINGEMIPEQFILDFVGKYKEDVLSIRPSFFEWTVALAFQYFKEKEVDIAILETGMGGRLDSTNVVIPEISIITNIGFDHMRFLGSTRAEIAYEKAGIIKPGIPVVVGESNEGTDPVFVSVASERKSELVFADQAQIDVPDADLKGPYQRKNIKTVMCAMEALIDKGWKLDYSRSLSALTRVKSLTGLRGRWEWLSREPAILLDMAHNVDAIALVMDEIVKLRYPGLHIVWGMVSDKNIDDILKILPEEAQYYFCKPDIPRGLDVHQLHKSAKSHNLKGSEYMSVVEAFHAAKQNAKSEDLIFVGGSSFVVAEVV